MPVVARSQKFLQAKFGGVKDDVHEEDKEEQESLWSGKKKIYIYIYIYICYLADNVDQEVMIWILFAMCPILLHTPSQIFFFPSVSNIYFLVTITYCLYGNFLVHKLFS